MASLTMTNDIDTTYVDLTLFKIYSIKYFTLMPAKVLTTSLPALVVASMKLGNTKALAPILRSDEKVWQPSRTMLLESAFTHSPFPPCLSSPLSPFPLLLHTLTAHRIKNPLAGIPKAQLLQDVENFANQHDLQDVKDLLIKGALVAQNPTRINSISELDEEDRKVIIEEVTHKWRQPKVLYMTIFLNSVAAAIQGWDQTGNPSFSSLTISSIHV